MKRKVCPKVRRNVRAINRKLARYHELDSCFLEAHNRKQERPTWRFQERNSSSRCPVRHAKRYFLLTVPRRDETDICNRQVFLVIFLILAWRLLCHASSNRSSRNMMRDTLQLTIFLFIVRHVTWAVTQHECFFLSPTWTSIIICYLSWWQWNTNVSSFPRA